MMSYSECAWLYIRDLVLGTVAFLQLFVGAGAASNLYSPDRGSQDSISTPTL